MATVHLAAAAVVAVLTSSREAVEAFRRLAVDSRVSITATRLRVLFRTTLTSARRTTRMCRHLLAWIMAEAGAVDVGVVDPEEGAVRGEARLRLLPSSSYLKNRLRAMTQFDLPVFYLLPYPLHMGSRGPTLSFMLQKRPATTHKDYCILQNFYRTADAHLAVSNCLLSLKCPPLITGLLCNIGASPHSVPSQMRCPNHHSKRLLVPRWASRSS